MPAKDFDARLDLVPTSPGVYLMKDKNGTIIYVGKAINLRRRLQSYFKTNPQGNTKVLAMIANIDDYSYLIVNNELEALLLESNLIKRYQPFYNILLKDDHDYPYIKVSMQEEFPKISKAYRIGSDEKLGAKYYGPYLNYDITKALNIIRKLFPMKIYHRIFQKDDDSSHHNEIFFKMSDSITSEIDGNDITDLGMEDSEAIKLNNQLRLKNQADIMDKNEYRAIINDVCAFLEGRYDGVRERMEIEMKAASEALEFERAAVWRDRINDLMRLQEKQIVVLDNKFFGDVIGLARNSVEVCVLKLEVRNGRIIGTSTYFLDAAANSDDEIINAFLLQYYTTASYIPPVILLPVEVNGGVEEQSINNYQKNHELNSDSGNSSILKKFTNDDIISNTNLVSEFDSYESDKNSEINGAVSELLKDIAGKKINLINPKRGKKFDVLKMANRNAKQSLQRKTLISGSSPESIEIALGLLQKILKIPSIPRRIESFDISNTGSVDISCGMAVFINGKVQRKSNRIFHIKYQDAQDDYSAMAEALDRRLKHLGDESFGDMPNLILADGGIGHVNALKPVLAKHNMIGQIYLAGMVKDQKHRTRGLVTFEGEIIELAESLNLLDGKNTYGSGNSIGQAKPLFSTDTNVRREEELALLRLLSAIQNESHRVANKGNKSLAKKRQIRYKLEEIPGVGVARRKILMKEFSSMKALSQCSWQEILERVPSIGEQVAKNIYIYFHPNEEE